MTGGGGRSGGRQRGEGLRAGSPAGASWSPEPVLALLHQLRVGGAAGDERLAEVLGWDRWDLIGALAHASSVGLVIWTPPIRAWRLTPAGRARAVEALRDEQSDDAASSGARAVLASVEEENARVLEACTAWQVHCDGSPGAGAGVIDTLEAARRRVDPQLRTWSASVARADRYRSRLSQALERARSGDGAWIASPRVDCFHGVWFQLHEDLLATLGRMRGGSPPGSPPSLPHTVRDVLRAAPVVEPEDRAAPPDREF